MSLYVSNEETGYMHAEAQDLARKLKEGDGLLWSGDPDLELHIGVITKKVPLRGRVPVARRYEVWRHCEDGADRIIGHWRMEEFAQIIPDIAIMRGALERPNEVASVEDRIEANNAAVEKAKSDEYVEAVQPLLEYALELDHDREQGRNTFRQVGGLRDTSAETDTSTGH